MVSYHPAKFPGNKHCGGGDLLFLLCCLTSRTHVNQEPSDFR